MLITLLRNPSAGEITSRRKAQAATTLVARAVSLMPLVNKVDNIDGGQVWACPVIKQTPQVTVFLGVSCPIYIYLNVNINSRFTQRIIAKPPMRRVYASKTRKEKLSGPGENCRRKVTDLAGSLITSSRPMGRPQKRPDDRTSNAGGSRNVVMFGSHESTIQIAFRSVQPFYGPHGCNQQTDRQTDRHTYHTTSLTTGNESVPKIIKKIIQKLLFKLQ